MSDVFSTFRNDAFILIKTYLTILGNSFQDKIPPQTLINPGLFDN